MTYIEMIPEDKADKDLRMLYSQTNVLDFSFTLRYFV